MKLMDYPAGNRENGFSLIELLFAMAIFLIILAAATSAFISQRKSYKSAGAGSGDDPGREISNGYVEQ